MAINGGNWDNIDWGLVALEAGHDAFVAFCITTGISTAGLVGGIGMGIAGEVSAGSLLDHIEEPARDIEEVGEATLKLARKGAAEGALGGAASKVVKKLVPMISDKTSISNNAQQIVDEVTSAGLSSTASKLLLDFEDANNVASKLDDSPGTHEVEKIIVPSNVYDMLRQNKTIYHNLYNTK